ncbi:HAD family hydrolase [candidate division KSB1 bacterium]
MAAWAVLDVDGTLLPGSSMEREFLKYLIRNRLIPFGNAPAFLMSGLRSLFSIRPGTGFAKNKSYIRNMPASLVNGYAKTCFQTNISPYLSHNGMENVRSLRSRGFKIMIMSGSPYFLVELLESIVHPDHIVSTGLEKENERFTGKISGIHPYGKRKKTVLMNLQAELDIQFEKSIVYANHHSDTFHMELFGTAVAVNPTRRLQALAEKQGWEIVHWV